MFYYFNKNYGCLSWLAEFSDDEISSVKTKSEVDHEEEADDDNDVDDSDDNDGDDDDDDDDDEGNILSQLDERLSDSETHTDSKAGLADAMAKILKKQIPAHQQIILAKGTTDKELAKKRQNIDEDSRETQVSQQKVKIFFENYISEHLSSFLRWYGIPPCRNKQ